LIELNQSQSILRIKMYDKNSKKDWLGSAITAALGAGIVTTFAISQGQHPLMAFGITGFAVAATLLFDHFMP
jgi:hypothetical protein